jgi:hypothetical protein
MELVIDTFSLIRGGMLVEMNNTTSIKLRRSDMFFLPNSYAVSRAKAFNWQVKQKINAAAAFAAA